MPPRSVISLMAKFFISAVIACPSREQWSKWKRTVSSGSASSAQIIKNENFPSSRSSKKPLLLVYWINRYHFFAHGFVHLDSSGHKSLEAMF